MNIKTKNAKRITVCDDTTFKWENDGTRYCVHIQIDDVPLNPREILQKPCTTMACFHPEYHLGDKLDAKDPEPFWTRYHLGDKLDAKDPETFWRNLVARYVSNDEIVKAIKDRKIDEFSIRRDENDPDSYVVTNYQISPEVSGNGKKRMVIDRANLSENQISDYVLYKKGLSVKNYQILLEPYIEWLPLWLYDHSGITMSTGEDVYPYNDCRDSSLVGWIVTPRDMVVKSSTEETWRERAVEIMQKDVKLYNQYIANEVYGFTVYQMIDGMTNKITGEPATVKLHSDYCFYGDDILESGLADEVGYGFEEALRSEKYEIGKANLRHISYYEF